jgi:hypothetical protein
MDAILQIFKFSHHHITTSPHHHILITLPPTLRHGGQALKGSCNLVQLYAVFTFKQIIKELAPHGCESSNLQIFKFSHHHITTSS